MDTKCCKGIPARYDGWTYNSLSVLISSFDTWSYACLCLGLLHDFFDKTEKYAFCRVSNYAWDVWSGSTRAGTNVPYIYDQTSLMQVSTTDGLWAQVILRRVWDPEQFCLVASAFLCLWRLRPNPPSDIAGWGKAHWGWWDGLSQ